MYRKMKIFIFLWLRFLDSKDILISKFRQEKYYFNLALWYECSLLIIYN